MSERERKSIFFKKIMGMHLNFSKSNPKWGEKSKRSTDHHFQRPVRSHQPGGENAKGLLMDLNKLSFNV